MHVDMLPSKAREYLGFSSFFEYLGFFIVFFHSFARGKLKHGHCVPKKRGVGLEIWLPQRKVS